MVDSVPMSNAVARNPAASGGFWLLLAFFLFAVGLGIPYYVAEVGPLLHPDDAVARWYRFAHESEAPQFARDPFAPASFESGAMHSKALSNPLRGIVHRDGQLLANIDGKLCRQGSWVRGMKVLKVAPDKVVLANNRTLRVYFLF